MLREGPLTDKGAADGENTKVQGSESQFCLLFCLNQPICSLSPSTGQLFREVLLQERKAGTLSLKWRSKNVMRMCSSDHKCILCKIIFHHGKLIVWTKRLSGTVTLKDF